MEKITDHLVRVVCCINQFCLDQQKLKVIVSLHYF